jgi:hypothetical protein
LVCFLRLRLLTDSVGEVDEVAPTPVRLATSDFGTGARRGHTAAIASGSVESPICDKQRGVACLDDSPCRELDRRLHSHIVSEGFTRNSI